MKMRINKPIVKRQIRDVRFIRSGRGFSKSELKEVGVINFTMAKNKGVPVDLLRKTTIAENVEQLKLVAKDILNMSKQQKRKGNIDSRKTSLTQAGSNMQ
jgi:ribosomal protein L13E